MIEVKNLTKYYGDFPAVLDLSFTITPGKIYGFLGPNGAGKSTTMNILTGCLAATSGEVKIGGFDIFEQPRAAKKLVGYLPEQPPLYIEQTTVEYLTFVARAKGLKKKEIGPEIERVIVETHIESVAEKLIRHLSKGFRQRVGIAQALIGNPEIIILDEPTVGLDPAQTIEMRELIHDLGENHTVILSSHILSEIQAMCDEVLIIYRGRLVAFDTLENLSKSMPNTVQLEAECSAQALQEALAELPSYEKIENIEITAEDDSSVTAALTVGEAEPKEICREIYLLFAGKGIVLPRLNPVKPTLEDIFIQLTTDADETLTVDNPYDEDEEEAEAEEEEAEETEEPEETEKSVEAEEPTQADEPEENGETAQTNEPEEKEGEECLQ
ncbi:MAG: ABC transporter ATP-binding protein [Firmicutes bacterium]|nr:ABC transporter ATP-binding protein [Bacillota bacterium]